MFYLQSISLDFSGGSWTLELRRDVYLAQKNGSCRSSWQISQTLYPKLVVWVHPQLIYLTSSSQHVVSPMFGATVGSQTQPILEKIYRTLCQVIFWPMFRKCKNWMIKSSKKWYYLNITYLFRAPSINITYTNLVLWPSIFTSPIASQHTKLHGTPHPFAQCFDVMLWKVLQKPWYQVFMIHNMCKTKYDTNHWQNHH